MKSIECGGRWYEFRERFDCNLTVQYENDWSDWHVLREILSNALDSVGGDVSKVSIREDDGFIRIADQGAGYPVVYAKRIGASSKKKDNGSIGQFGEGMKMAALTCLRKGIAIRFASQNWLIEPGLVQVEEGIQVLVYDIYKSAASTDGSYVSIQATEQVQEIVCNLHDWFLQVSPVAPLSGTMMSGIYPATNDARIYNKGVYIKAVDAMFSYGISINELNRDRDLINDDSLCRNIRDIWGQVDNPELINAYFQESHKAGMHGVASKYKEYRYNIFPNDRGAWRTVFTRLFGEKAVISTNELASREAVCLGYDPVKLEYYGQEVAQYIGIQKDSDVCRSDFEYTWAENLTPQEEERVSFFRRVAEMLEMECPQLKVFDSYAKSDYIAGVYNAAVDEIYLKRTVLSDDVCSGLDTFLHELVHRHTGADDYTREFAAGLSLLASKLALRLANEVGMPVKVRLTDRGFEMPKTFAYSADKLDAIVAIGGRTIIIETGQYRLKARIKGRILSPYSTMRSVTFFKGRFHVNIPASIRQQLPDEVSFYVAENV